MLQGVHEREDVFLALVEAAAHLNIHLHCLVLNGAYGRGTDGELKIITAILETPMIEQINGSQRTSATASSVSPAMTEGHGQEKGCLNLSSARLGHAVDVPARTG